MSTNALGHEIACLRDAMGERGKLQHVAFYHGTGRHNIDAAEMFREYDIRIEAGPDKHGITQAQFLYVLEPGGNRIELFSEPGILQLEPDYETRTGLMEDIDTGLAIGGAKPLCLLRRSRRLTRGGRSQQDRCGGVLPTGRRRCRAAEDPLGKVLRKTMRGMAHGKDEPLPSTIEDPAVLHALRPVLRRELSLGGEQRLLFDGVMRPKPGRN